MMPRPIASQNLLRRGQYAKVFDLRKRRIRGLWERNHVFYAQFTFPDESSGRKSVRRVRLEDDQGNPVPTVAEAVKVMNKLKVQRNEHQLKFESKRTPTFAEYADAYLAHYTRVKDAKRPATLHRENTCLVSLKKFMGDLRLHQITKAVVSQYMAARQSEGRSGRTVNIELVTLRNVLKKAVDEKLLKELGIEGIKWLPNRSQKRRLLTKQEIDKLCSVALSEAPITGLMLGDFIRLMAYSGGRWAETLRLRWSDVDFEQKKLNFGTDGLTKNGQARVVDFSVTLEAHLQAMHSRRTPDSKFLFPSTKRGGGDAATLSYNRVLRKVRDKAGIPDFTCHLARHYFVSQCVMAGIDYLSIAQWVGHQDGGVLIGRVYGHLNDAHTRKQAGKLEFKT